MAGASALPDTVMKTDRLMRRNMAQKNVYLQVPRRWANIQICRGS
jgi:hypothetical protein